MLKIFIICMLIAMIISLFVGLLHLLKPSKETNEQGKVVMALTWRIGIWVILFAFIMLSIKLGWLKPSNSINPSNFKIEQLERKNSN